MNKELNILYTCDNEYLDMTAISMESVVKNNAEAIINFYIATESKGHSKFLLIKNHYKDNNNISINWLDLKDYDDILEKKELPKWGGTSFYVYWKLFAYQKINKKNVIYLDSDVICLSEIILPSISTDKSVGMSLDAIHSFYYRITGLNKQYYFFNSGLMFVDTQKWIKNKCLDKILNYIYSMQDKPLMCDQDIIANALQNDVEILLPKYNYLSCYDYYGVSKCFRIYSLEKRKYYKKHEIENDRDKIIFYHCLGGECGRPWDDNNTNPIKKEYEKYKETSAFKHFHAEQKKNILFKLQKIVHLFPDNIYVFIHSFAIVVRLWILKILDNGHNRSL